MIISHRHRFIFIKTKKTAGTSLEIALSALCGPDDIITPISPRDEQLRRDLGFRGPQNYQLPDGRQFFNHASASAVRQVVGTGIWDNYFTFCFERNPWDKVISWYHWECQQRPDISFGAFLASGHFALVGGPGGFDLYTDNGDVIVDRVCRYEDMASELALLAARFGTPLPTLPKAKSGFRRDRRHYSEVYTAQQRELVAQAFRREIALLGYRFEPAASIQSS